MPKQYSIIRKVIFALIIFLMFGELGLRLFKREIRTFYPAGKTFPPIYIRSDMQGFALKPDTNVVHYNYFDEFIKRYHINTKGLRGYTEDGDIVMAGDSFAFGIGLNDDETVPYCLEKISGLKVVNAGIPSYSVDNAYLLLKKYSPEKIVVLTFFLGNDIDDIGGHEWITDASDLPVKIIPRKVHVDNYNHLTETDEEGYPLKEFLRNHSFFYTVLSEHRYILKWKLQWLRARLKEMRENKKEKKPAPPAPIGFGGNESIAKAKRLFRAMKEGHGKFLVLVISSQKPIASEVQLKEHMISFFEDEKIDFVCPPNAPDSLYYKRDCHWTKSGSEHVARVAYQKLKELCWL